MRIDRCCVGLCLLVVLISIFCLVPRNAAAVGSPPNDVTVVLGVVEGTTVTLYWPVSMSLDTIGYKVSISLDGLAYDPEYDVGLDTIFTFSGLSTPQPYWFKVKAYNGVGDSSGRVAYHDLGSGSASSLSFPIEGGTTVAAYRMISFPLGPNDTLVGALSGTLGSYDPSQWRLFRWDPQAGGYREGNDAECFRPWRSYWLISKNTVLFDGTIHPIDSSNSCTVILYPGWNQIANPFGDPVSLSGAPLYTDGGVEIFGDIMDPGNIYTTRGAWGYCTDPLCSCDGYDLYGDIGPSIGIGYWIKNKMTYEIFLSLPNPGATKPGERVPMKADPTGEDQPPAPPGGFGAGSGGGGGGCFLSAAGL